MCDIFLLTYLRNVKPQDVNQYEEPHPAPGNNIRSHMHWSVAQHKLVHRMLMTCEHHFMSACGLNVAL